MKAVPNYNRHDLVGCNPRPGHREEGDSNSSRHVLDFPQLLFGDKKKSAQWKANNWPGASIKLADFIWRKGES